MARSIGTRMSAPSSVGSAINKPIDVLSRLKSGCISCESGEIVLHAANATVASARLTYAWREPASLVTPASP
jgi:hypothetical protein